MNISKIFNPITVIGIFILMAITSSCSDKLVGVDGFCPLVESTTPVNLAADVQGTTAVTVTFEEKINPATMVPAAFILTTIVTDNSTGSPVNQTIEINGSMSFNNDSNTMTFTPSSPLASNTVYTGRVKNTIEDPMGNKMLEDFVWTFTTEEVVVSDKPIVISTDPGNGESDVALDKIITVTFSEEMNPATINTTTITLHQGTTSISGSVTYSGVTATFTPDANLVAGTLYTIGVTIGAENAAGDSIVEFGGADFTTSDGDDNGDDNGDDEADKPTVISTDPSNGAVDVALDKIITVTFSEEMNSSTINTSTVTLHQGTTSISGSVTYSGVTATFTPDELLIAGTLYTIGVTEGAQNPAGDGIEEFGGADFTTAEAADKPTVISTDPSNGDVDVALDKIITVTFSEAMNSSTINTTTITLHQGTTSISGSVTYSGVTATFTPDELLIAGTLYTIGVTEGAENPAGDGIEEFGGADFTTAEAADKPTVISTDPNDGDVEVALDKVITVTFSEEMDPATINTSTVTLHQGTTSISGSVTYSGVTATFTPDELLVAGTLYTIGVTEGAENPAGDGIEEFGGADFTTAEAAAAPVVDLGRASRFGAYGGSAGVTNQGINTVINGSIGTTGASTLITGFHDELTGDVYTETTLNVGAVTDGIFTAPPAPGTATSQQIAEDALADATAARNSISPGSLPGGIDLGTDELGGLTLEPGTYLSATGSYAISDVDLTLDAQGDANATWIFQAESSLTVGTPTGPRSIIMTNGALPENVFWFVGSSATINGAGGGTMVGTILTDAGVTFSTAGNVEQTVLNGRAISLTASVTMVNTTINVPE